MSPALLELHEQHRAAGLDPMHTPVFVVGDNEPWPQPLTPPPPEWQQEAVERAERQAAERRAEAAREAAKL